MPTTSAAQANRNLEVAIAAGKAASEKALGVVGMMISNQVKILITQIFPPQSAPGTPPHLRSGGLRISYDFKVHPAEGGSGPSVVVFSDSETRQPIPPGKRVIYAPFVEYGTSKMAPRPHLRPAVAAITPLIPGIIAAAWSDGVRAGAELGI